ncbi:MAG: FecR family protein [Elusimicrobiota bacterium]|jgi:hypothetical protein
MKSLAILLLAAAAASAQVPSAGLTRIGAAAAVRGAVKAQAQGAAVGRVLESGKPVYLNDHVTTDASGRLQILLVDQTAFTIGPNSDMVLDEFVYDPATDAGKVTANVTKGVFRFVTGKVARQDPANMKVKLPVGTIGIRGTIAGGQVSAQSATIILLGPGANNNANENPGAVNVANANGDVTITQPGFGTTITMGQAPSAVTNMAQQAQQLTAALNEAPAAGPAPKTTDSASKDSGQDTAAGTALAGGALEISALSTSLSAQQQLASQTLGIANGISSWDQVRSIESGTGLYLITVNNSGWCVNNTCGAGTAVNLGFDMSVNFGAKTYGSGLVQIGGAYTDSVTISPSMPFGSSGNAIITLTNGINSNNSAFNGTTITLMNRDGIAAKDAKLDMNYTSSSGEVVSGSITAPR